MSITTKTPATLDDLERVEGKAELIGGRIVRSMPSGYKPSRIAFQIAMRLELRSSETGEGVAFADGIGFAINPPLSSGRQSFSPDASFYVGSIPSNDMRFIEGSPTLAVEVRSENDYGPAAESEMAAKRADYFEAGTEIVWDVDPVARTIAVYQGDPRIAVEVVGVGQFARAESILPGWRLAVDDLFS